MAVNEWIIRGAGLQARAKNVGKLAGVQAVDQASRYIRKGLGHMFQSRNKEFNRILANQINNPDLTEQEKDNLYEQLEKQRFRYVYLNERRMRTKMEEDLDTQANDLVTEKSFFGNLSETALDANSNQNTNTIPESHKQDIEFHVTNQPPPVTTTDGIKGRIITNPDSKKFEYSWQGEKETMPSSVANFYKKYLDQKQVFSEMELTEDEGEEYNRRKKELQIIDINNLPEDLQFVTDEEFIDIINGYGPDDNSEIAFQNHINSTIKNAKNIQPGQSPDFNWSITYDKMKTFEANGNSRSIWNNPIIGGRIPREDLIQAIRNSTYEQYGINMSPKEIDAIKNMDPTDESPITDDDAIRMVEEIINNQPELRSDLLADYLTKLTGDIYLNSLNQDVLRSMTFPSVGPSFMNPEEAGQKLEEIEEQKQLYRPSLYQGGKV
tara:strand:- start:635 stop:1945 length:1311 start_codon:yes stop_codon:yes gene_type:complete